MSSCYRVKVTMPSPPAHLAAVPAGDTVFLNTRGRPCGPEQAARLDTRELAEALARASSVPIRERYGQEVAFAVVEAAFAVGQEAERVAADSEEVRDWLAAHSGPPG